MSTASFILFPGVKAWRLCTDRAGEVVCNDVAVPAELSSDETAKLVLTAMQQSGYAGEPAVLAIPAAWCFAASISTVDLPKHDRKAMLFRIEEKLPVPAEALIADFIARESDFARPVFADGTLGVCARIDLVRPLVEALEKAGIAVGCISPASLLGVQKILESEQNAPSVLVCGSADPGCGEVNIVTIAGGRPAGWSVLACNAVDLKSHLDLLFADGVSSQEIALCDVNAKVVEAVESFGLKTVRYDATVSMSAAQLAGRVAQGRRQPWIDFRRGPLAVRDPLLRYRRTLNIFLTSAVAMLLVCAGVCLVRAERYNRLQRSAEQELANAFRKAFPGWALPANVRVVVESEHQKAVARKGDALPADGNRSAVQTLHDLLGNLPAAKPFTLGRMTILDSSFEIEGRLRSYEDADEIAAAARKAGYDVPPPQARKESDGFWSFTLRGSLSAKPAVAQVSLR